MKEIKNILICGAGMMGKNIGYVFASNPSFQVGMYDLYPTDVEAGIRTNTKQLLDKGVITEQELSDRLSRISFTNDIDSDLVKNADLVIEAVFEDMKIKRETFAKLEARCRPDTIFCTNSSVMSPSEISAELQHRERFVGTHFWNPGHLIPLVEVVKSGPACHTGAESCFFNEVYVSPELKQFSWQGLYDLIKGRKTSPKEGSYTTYLFEKGKEKILKKVGEECTEVIIAGEKEDKAETVYEISDLAYHVLVLMVQAGITVEDITRELEKRHVIDHKVKQERMQ